MIAAKFTPGPLFDVSRSDAQMIIAIVRRAMRLGIQGYTALDCDMDVTACHANGMPLDLERLLAADDFNFAHDILGIRRHINRRTGRLGDCFVPRFAFDNNDAKAKGEA